MRNNIPFRQPIFVVYDIFGFFPQNLQGTDILAHSDKEHQYHVFMPHFFDGEPADISWYPADTKEKEEKLGNFFHAKANPKMHLPKIKECVAEAAKFPQIESWGIMGYCWGGKITSIVAGAQTKFKAAAQLHPGMLDVADAVKVQIPMCLLTSKDENPDNVKKYSDNLTVKKHVDIYDTQIHGWMAVRADLKDPAAVKEYERATRRCWSSSTRTCRSSSHSLFPFFSSSPRPAPPPSPS